MDEFRKNCRSIVTNVIKIYEERLKDATETGQGVDLLGLNALCMDETDKLDGYLSEFFQRVKNNKKKMW